MAANIGAIPEGATPQVRRGWHRKPAGPSPALSAGSHAATGLAVFRRIRAEVREHSLTETHHKSA